MKVLMFGRGVISTQYGWALEKAGHTVEFYVRPGRMADYGNTVALNILDGRVGFRGKAIKETWAITLKEDIPENHDYDLIIVSVKHTQFKEAANFLSSRVGNATILIFNNFWNEPLEETAMFSQNQLVWGFPAAGGEFNTEGVLNGAFLTRITFGTFKTELSERDKTVRNLFQKSGFKIIEYNDFRSYLLIHFAVNAGMHSQSLKVGSVTDAVNISRNWKESVLNVKELVPVLHARGVDTKDSQELIITKIPWWINITKILIKVSPPIRIIMTSITNVNTDEVKSFGRDVLLDARRLKIQVPRLEANEKYFL